jgi:hypothetical protein
VDSIKEIFIVKAALGSMSNIEYEDRELLLARLRGAITSLNKVNNKSMVISLMANFRSQLSVVSKEEFEFALNFNKDLIYGSLGLKK